MWVCLELKLVRVKRRNKRSSGLRAEDSGVDKINYDDDGDDIKRNKPFRRVFSFRSYCSSSRAAAPPHVLLVQGEQFPNNCSVLFGGTASDSCSLFFLAYENIKGTVILLCSLLLYLVFPATSLLS